MTALTKLSPQEVVIALETLSDEETRKLAFNLGVDTYVLDNIDSKFSSGNRKIPYIQAWLNKDTESSWEKVVFALVQIRMNVLARQVATHHCPHLSAAATHSSGPHQPATDYTLQPVNQNLISTLILAMPSHQPHVASPTTQAMQSISSAIDHSQLVAVHLPLPTSPVTNSPHNRSSPPAILSDQPQTFATCQPSNDVFWSLEKVKATILLLEEMFANLHADTQMEIAKLESENQDFLRRFRSRLFLLEVAKKAPHSRFFQTSRKEILKAEDTDTILAILCTYIDYRNYEVLLQLITRYGSVQLQERMKKYCMSLQTYEMHTSVEVYISAKPERISEEVKDGFSQMVMKINKPASKCTLLKIREFNESIIKGSGLEPYCSCIDSITKKCVVFAVKFPSTVVGWVLAAMTPDFMCTHHLTEVTIDKEELIVIQAEREELVCTYIHLCKCKI